MHRTTVMLPQDLKNQALQQARERGVSLGEIVRQSLIAHLQSLKETKGEDPFLADSAIFEGEAPRDLSENHDVYLYGGKS